MKFPKTVKALAVGAVLIAAGCQQKPPAEPTSNLTDEQKAIYAFGAAIGQQVSQQTSQLRFTPEEMQIFRGAFSETLEGKKPALEINDYQQAFQQLAEARIAAGAEEAKQKGEEYLVSAAKEEGAVKTDSGLVFRTITAGTGPSPQATDTVRVHYHGTLTDGTVFDSSVDRGEPAEFALGGVIPCWTEGVQRMKVGEKARLVCPAAIAYGDRAAGKIPAGSTLVFEVDLLGIVGK